MSHINLVSQIMSETKIERLSEFGFQYSKKSNKTLGHKFELITSEFPVKVDLGLEMFSSREHLQKKTGPFGVGRFSYLQSLVTEFQDTDSQEAKEQVLANLGNFAYDPINYEYIRVLHIIDLFLDCIQESGEKMVEYAVGGLCNLCLDKQNKEYILGNDGVKLVTQCLSSDNEETVFSAITALMYLVTPGSRQEITALPIVDAMLRFSKSKNGRLRNLADIFLQDYCSPAQVEEAAEAQRQWEAQVQAQAATVTQAQAT